MAGCVGAVVVVVLFVVVVSRDGHLLSEARTIIHIHPHHIIEEKEDPGANDAKRK